MTSLHRESNEQIRHRLFLRIREVGEGLHLRNERQDAALATQATPADRDELKKRLGECSARPSADPEAYLKVRDFFYSPLWMSIRNSTPAIFGIPALQC